MRVLRKAAECRVAHEYIRLLARSKKASSRRENDASCSRQSRFLQGRSDGANGWCRGPESNWLRPPFQGGALPMSYPGFVGLFNFRDDSERCQFGFRAKPVTVCAITPENSAISPEKLLQLRPAIPKVGSVIKARISDTTERRINREPICCSTRRHPAAFSVIYSPRTRFTSAAPR